jgi:hypothetical protein
VTKRSVNSFGAAIRNGRPGGEEGGTSGWVLVEVVDVVVDGTSVVDVVVDGVVVEGTVVEGVEGQGVVLVTVHAGVPLWTVTVVHDVLLDGSTSDAGSMSLT